MSQIQANFGDSSEGSGLRIQGSVPVQTARVNRFADFVYWAIEAAQAIKPLAHRWRVPEETLRRYRDGLATPTLDRLLHMRFNDAELLALLLLLGAGRVKIEILNADDRDRLRQGQIAGIAENELRGRMIQFTGAAQTVVEVIHEALADGQIDETETRTIETAVDAAQATAGRLRPSIFGKVRALVCRCLRRC